MGAAPFIFFLLLVLSVWSLNPLDLKQPDVCVVPDRRIHVAVAAAARWEKNKTWVKTQTAESSFSTCDFPGQSDRKVLIM